MNALRAIAFATGILLAGVLGTGCWSAPDAYPLSQTGGAGGAGATGGPGTGGGTGGGVVDANDVSMIDGSGALHFDSAAPPGATSNAADGVYDATDDHAVGDRR